VHGHGVEQVEQDRVEVQVGCAITLEMDEGVRRLSTVVAGEAELVAMFGVQNREHPRGKFSQM